MGRVGDSICAHDFNPRSPHGERPGKLLTAMIYTLRISIHAPRTGSDIGSSKPSISSVISIHAPRTGSDESYETKHEAKHISIHAPRTGSDQIASGVHQHTHISIHAPRTGSDRTGNRFIRWNAKFQSTLPARGATMTENASGMELNDFNPRSPHGERPWRCWEKEPTREISIHAPRTGSDCTIPVRFAICWNFNPRSPHGERPARSFR